jgi:ribosomal protein L37AE/L43A
VARLKPFSPATCPHCGKKETSRVGYSEQKMGSIWTCASEGCGQVFVLPMLALARKSG